MAHCRLRNPNMTCIKVVAPYTPNRTQPNPKIQSQSHPSPPLGPFVFPWLLFKFTRVSTIAIRPTGPKPRGEQGPSCSSTRASESARRWPLTRRTTSTDSSRWRQRRNGPWWVWSSRSGVLSQATRDEQLARCKLRWYLVTMLLLLLLFRWSALLPERHVCVYSYLHLWST